MEFKSIEFTGDHSIKTTYMAGEVDQDEYTVTCSDLPRPELRTTGLAILPGVLTMTLGDDAISCLKKGYQDWTPVVVLRKLSIRIAKKMPWTQEVQIRVGINDAALVTDWIGIKDFMGDNMPDCADSDLSDKIKTFIDEAMKYINGERAQGQLFTDNEAREIAEAMNSTKKIKEDNSDELEALKKQASERRKKVYKEVCKDCVNYIDKKTCSICMNHNCFEGIKA